MKEGGEGRIEGGRGGEEHLRKRRLMEWKRTSGEKGGGEMKEEGGCRGK